MWVPSEACTVTASSHFSGREKVTCSKPSRSATMSSMFFEIMMPKSSSGALAWEFLPGPVLTAQWLDGTAT